jgi:hypothetical protein
MNGKFHGRRSVERPRIRWEDIRRDFSMLLNIRRWRRVVGDRCVCGELLLKAGHGCRADEEKEKEEKEEEEEEKEEAKFMVQCTT